VIGMRFLLYGLAALAIVTTITGGYYYVQTLQDNLVEAQEANAKYQISIQLKEQELTSLTTQLEVAKKARDEAELSFALARESAAKLDKVFGNHDFGRLLHDKPGLINNRMRDGTAKLFHDLESASNSKAQ